ncbi:DEAD/DEAH box helicase [Bacillus licheniformis]|nr:DEAD/DEAH box helicase [Bacillus licheniformis]
MVGTPGRIADLIREQALDVHKAGSFVIDEADLMLDMGFWKMSIYRVAYAGRLADACISATIPEN